MSQNSVTRHISSSLLVKIRNFSRHEILVLFDLVLFEFANTSCIDLQHKTKSFCLCTQVFIIISFLQVLQFPSLIKRECQIVQGGMASCKLLHCTYCTKIYPMAFICLSPLSAEIMASFPHELESSGCPNKPNPILESQVEQSFSWLLRIPILALMLVATLNPSLLQFRCSEA